MHRGASRGDGYRRAVAAGAAAIAVVAAAAGCSSTEDQVPSIGYAVDNVLATYNANTVDGTASGARQAFSRVLTGMSYIGPEGAALSDGDFGSAVPQPGDSLTIAYKINPNAVYSDGVPVTCDDLVLAWAAGSGKFPQFASATRAGYADIDRVDCQSGSKDATVVFKPGRAFAEWLGLFGATEVMPAHVAGRVANVPDVVGAVRSGDVDALGRIAAFWNNGWNLTPGQLDPALFPSSGPYRADSYTDDGGLVLVANDRWWGNKPATNRIVVWPKSSDLKAKLASGSLDVIDVGANAVEGLDPGGGFTTVTEPSRSSEQLVFGTGGVFGSADVRKAFASCVPRQQLFDDLGHPDFKKAAGLGSGVLNSRIVAPDMLIYPTVSGVAGDRYLHPDVAAATSGLGGQKITVRIGYLAPDKRRADTVAAIAAACAPAGITVQDAGTPGFVPSGLATGQVDAILGGTASAQGPAGADSQMPPAYSLAAGNGTNYGQYHNNRVTEIADQLAVDTAQGSRLNLSTEAENILWAEMPSIPLFNEPRTTAIAKGMHAAVPNPSVSGAGWNMDRWILLR
ncbi:ABC transporter substrate-binding protein [Rhodococcus sp. NPDC127528]|uniref:ABC transporter substrate-binding protein n=1 Tax=unclassified Rhodococcus (in: high G+C Gram-positive bacteria) TaxID=192944 RepID=UPI00362F06AD